MSKAVLRDSRGKFIALNAYIIFEQIKIIMFIIQFGKTTIKQTQGNYEERGDKTKNSKRNS